MSAEDTHRRRLAEMRAERAQRISEQVAEIRSNLDQAFAEVVDPEVLRFLYRSARDVATAAGTFGFPEVSRQARALELLIEGFIVAKSMPSLSEQSSVRAHLDGLIWEASKGLKESAAQAAGSPEWPSDEESERRLVYLLEPDEAAAGQFFEELGRRGFIVRSFPSRDELPEALACVRPAALVLDAADLGELSSPGAFDGIGLDRAAFVPVVLMSDEDDLASRVAAVRAGASAFLVKPVEPDELVEVLKEACGGHGPAPYRVLLADGDVPRAKGRRKALLAEGLETTLVSDPGELLEALSATKPDAVLLCARWGDYEGAEVAAAIRQERESVGVPILLLAEEREEASELPDLAREGGFLLLHALAPKPLATVVRGVAAGSASLRARLRLDGLTGLLSRSAFERNLERDLARAKRRKTKLCLALIEVDSLDEIAGKCGHRAGDEILRSLSSLLSRHLRKTDAVGRVAENLFAMTLPLAEGHSGVRVMDKIREIFRPSVRSEGGKLEARLSCGLAEFPRYPSTEALWAAAERALAEARSGGGGRVALAAETPIGSRKILVVDDEPRIVRFLQVLLEESGYQVVTAPDGRAGLEMAQQHKPDLVLSDLLMPRMNGFDMCKRIKETPELGHTRVLMMTAVYKKGMYRNQAKDSGADDFIEKPFDTDTLIKKVEGFLRREAAPPDGPS